jgi:CheY-like chemotaxis protein
MTVAAVDVLVVDDNEAILDLATRSLERGGFTVASATDFAQLEKMLATAQPRLILMDVQMPELFGDEVAAILRNVRGVKAKIVLHSSLDDVELDDLVKTARLDGWIAKSAGINHLVEEVRRLLTP